MDGLMTVCHDARKGRTIGSHWPNHVAPPLHSTSSGSGQKDRRSLVFCRTLKLVHNSLLGKGLPSEPNIVEIVTLAQVSVTRVFWIG